MRFTRYKDVKYYLDSFLCRLNNRSEDIKAIVEFKEHGFAGSWYIVFRYRDQPLKIKHPINPVNTSRMMKDFDIYNKHTVYEMSHQSHILN